MAAFPLHFYAGDVYEGAGTPVTAFLAFVPKTAGFIALIRILTLVGGPQFTLPPELVRLLWIISALTMSIGNVLGLLQSNIKRTLAYSSIAHSGYMLVAVAALAGPHGSFTALQGVLFYLAAYGIMNSGAFGVLMLLPSRFGSGSAETFDELAGQGRRHVLLGLVMTIACFSLIGVPLTVGFVGKVLLIRPALQNGLTWLAIILIVNAAVSAAYYLRIVGTLFLRPRSPIMGPDEQLLIDPNAPWRQRGVALGVTLSAVLTLSFGTIPPAIQLLSDCAAKGARPSIAAPGIATPQAPAPQDALLAPGAGATNPER
jgi:NADH-quinone oxidoreductase subunit N